jgi:hypothetical protein
MEKYHFVSSCNRLSQVTTYKQAFHPASETGGKIKLEINNTFFNFKNQGQCNSSTSKKPNIKIGQFGI